MRFRTRVGQGFRAKARRREDLVSYHVCFRPIADLGARSHYGRMKLPTTALPQLYTSLMEQIKVRLEAVNAELRAASDKRADFGGIVRAESACLQVRKATELLALAVVVAHNEHETFQSQKFVKQWNADAIFTALSKLNKESFPLRFTIDGVTDDGFANAVIEEESYLTREKLCRIYNDCGAQLHIGKLYELINTPKKLILEKSSAGERRSCSC